jgi:hypothetical protein
MSFPLFRPTTVPGTPRTSSVKINIQQHHDNKAFHCSDEDIRREPEVSQENIDSVAEMGGDVARNGECSGENFGNGERLKVPGSTVVEKGDCSVEIGADLGENGETSVGNPGESLTEPGEVLSGNDNADMTAF